MSFSPHSSEHSAELLAGTEGSLGESPRWAAASSGKRKAKEMPREGEELHGKSHHVREFLNINDNGDHDFNNNHPAA